jgi:hypothetical protein
MQNICKGQKKESGGNEIYLQYYIYEDFFYSTERQKKGRQLVAACLTLVPMDA